MWWHRWRLSWGHPDHGSIVGGHAGHSPLQSHHVVHGASQVTPLRLDEVLSSRHMVKPDVVHRLMLDVGGGDLSVVVTWLLTGHPGLLLAWLTSLLAILEAEQVMSHMHLVTGPVQHCSHGHVSTGTTLHLPGLRVDGGLMHGGSPMPGLDVNLTIIVNAVQLHCVGVHHIAMVLPNVCPQVILPVIATLTHRTGPYLGLGVLRVDVPLQALFVMKCLVTMHAFMIPEVLVSISDMSVENLD